VLENMQNNSPTTIRIKLFAAARQAVNADTIKVAIDSQSTIRNLKKSVAEQFPTLDRIISQSRWAINGEYALESDVVPTGAEIALIPPVSGG
jgi:molybdopterin converting factor subunit 1